MTRLVAFLSACAFAAALLGAPVQAQDKAALPSVDVAGNSQRNSVEKSYRKMLRGMDLFERQRLSMAPNATLRFRVLQRKPGVNLDDLELAILGRGLEIP